MHTIELKDRLIEANKAYRAGSPIMDDQTYDDLLESFQSQVSETEYAELRNTLNEGQIEQGKKLKHKWIAGSLDKLKYEEPKKICAFLLKNLPEGHLLSVSAKVDGLSGIAKYVGGQLISFATRGDGYEGVDITDKAKYIKGLPSNIECKDEQYVRGELVYLKDDQKRLDIKAARNVVAGVINRGEWDPKDVQDVSFIAYTVLGDSLTKAEQFNWLEEHGFNVADHTELSIDGFRGINDKGKAVVNRGFEEILFDCATQKFPYETDGLVISDTQYKNQNIYRPKAQVAFKTNLQRFETRLLDVSFEGPSKDGFFVPVGILDPIEINGAMIGKCHLHNLDFIETKKLKLGSIVSVCRSGDVIPKLLGVIKTDSNCVDVEYPEFCSCCGHKLVRDGINFRCTNKDCRDQKLYQIEHFIKRLGVQNCSYTTLLKFGIGSYDKLISFVPNLKHKSETGLVDELVKKVFTRSKQELLCALNFEGLAEITLNKIFDHFGVDDLLKYFRKNEDGEYVCSPNIITWFGHVNKQKGEPKGISANTINKFLDCFDQAVNDMYKFVDSGRWTYIEGAQPKVEAKIEYKGSVCFTGTLSISRGEAEKLARSAGFEPKGGVTKGLTYLVTNDPNSGSSKNRKAQELGTKIINEAEFMKIITSNTIEDDLGDL